MSPVVGLSVKRGALAAVSLRRGRVLWAGRAAFTGSDDLPAAIGALAAECPHRPGRIRVVLERDLVQMRSLIPAPPLRGAAVGRFVALEAPRLFRRNGAPLVTDGRLVPVPGQGRALYAAACAEQLLRAIALGCQQAGFSLVAMGPAADVLPRASAEPAAIMTRPDGTGTELLELSAAGTWRSRLVREREPVPTRWKEPLDALGDTASEYAAAFGAALSPPRLSLLPADSVAARRAAIRRSAVRLAIAAGAAWVLAASIYGARIVSAERAAGAELARLGEESARALALRRDLYAALGMLEQLRVAAATRSRQLDLLSRLVGGLNDSAIVVALTVRGDTALQLALLAPSASAALAQLERVPGVLRPRLEGPVARERTSYFGPSAGDWERFAVVAELARRP